VEIERAKARRLELLDANGGSITAAIVEQDAQLAGDHDAASAAAHALAAESEITTGQETDGREWFPYSFLIRSQRAEASEEADGRRRRVVPPPHFRSAGFMARALL
jgi:hypothetical protein